MSIASASATLSRAWYESAISDFLVTEQDTVIGRLTAANPRPTDPAQVDAWREEIGLLKQWLIGVRGRVFFEFSIPRMGRRVDAVIIVGSMVLVVEFKVGAELFDRSAIDQVWDYALDLKNFHEASHEPRVVPILVATKVQHSPALELRFDDDGVCRPVKVIPRDFRNVLQQLAKSVSDQDLDAEVWSRSPYRPTPTIVEAARALYSQHSVEAIARHDAGATNLSVTSRRIEEIVDEARRLRRKTICFVTGVPGAGKTLVGLNVATQRREAAETHAVFLSGNGPLVEVLRAALTRDERRRLRKDGLLASGDRKVNPVKAFIQNVHHFRDEALRDSDPPDDHVVIFDEAQRAWNSQKTAIFMKQRKGRSGFSDSEPAFLIRYMDRHEDWAVVVCLVGGGQEIHTGEAGIAEWIAAANRHFANWHLHISRRLTDDEYAAGKALTLVKGRENVHLEPDLHLAVSMRSFRAENVSAFVKAVLDRDAAGAEGLLGGILDRFPIVVTRDLSLARGWIRRRARGSERYGLVASSKAMRLKPHAIDVRVAISPVHWFLNDRTDVRSSDFLEDCATEFQVQGLELDWACVNWDADLRFDGREWTYYDFRGDRWTKIQKVGAPELPEKRLSGASHARAPGDGHFRPARRQGRCDAAARIL